MKDSVCSAIRTYLENKDWTLYPDPADFTYLVGRDANDLVFVKYDWVVDRDSFPDEQPIDRTQAEHMALTYMCEHPDIHTGPLRYDYITLVRVAEHRAVVRHHKNVLV